ncbi:MAG: aromatic ring-hydroxylating dioxygenase subunit alpha [Gaiellaceae bacterium]
MSATHLRHSLTRRDYTSPDVFELDRERIFFRRWFYVGREGTLSSPGDFLVADVAGESIVLVRGKDDVLRGFYNVCRHRGSRLCDRGGGQLRGAIKCPYHAWTYALDGRLIGTPMVGKDEIDRDSLSLWPVTVDIWAGFVYVNLADNPSPLRDALADQDDEPLSFEQFRLDELRLAHHTVTDVNANWKILVENYNECLHCPTVHPELVAVVPTYRKGLVIENGRSDGGVAIANGGTSFTRSGHSSLPVMPGLDEQQASSIYAALIFPNMFLDISGTSTVSTRLEPKSADRTTVITEYLFRPEVIDDPSFDPSEIVEFTELVAHQDYVVCERVQAGVSSRAFTHGVYPEKDELPYAFDRRYLAARDATD